MYGLLNQTVTIARFSSRDKYGAATYAAGTDYPARVELKERRRLMPNGELVVTAGRVILGPDVAVDTADKLTYSGQDYRVFSRNVAAGGNGATHHQTLELARWRD